MRTTTLFFLILFPMLSAAQTYRVSQLSFEGFKAYPDYGIAGEDIRQVITQFATESPVVEQSALFVLAAQLAEVYRSKGLVFHRVEVVLQAPTKLVLVPGVVSAVDIRGAERYRTRQLNPYFDDLFGRLVDNTSLQEAMLQMNAMPGVSGFAFLSFGALPGDAVVNVSVDDSDWGRLSTQINNYGASSTGAYRLTSQLTLNNPFRVGEQWRINGSVTDQYENWSAGVGVDVYRGARHRYTLNSAVQHIAVAQEFSLLDMSGWQGTVDVGYRFSPSRQYSRTFAVSLQAGTLYQKLENQAGITALDVDLIDFPVAIKLSGDFASVKQFLGYESSLNSGFLYQYQAPVELDEAYWVSYQSSLSLAQSITGASLQQGIDLKAQLSGQYALTELPSHRRFSLAGANKLASLASGTLSVDTGVFAEVSTSLFNVQLGPVRSALQLGAQGAYGQTSEESTDILTAFGATLDLAVGPFSTQNKWYTDDTFEQWQWWFELTLDWPKGY